MGSSPTSGLSAFFSPNASSVFFLALKGRRAILTDILAWEALYVPEDKMQPLRIELRTLGL